MSLKEETSIVIKVKLSCSKCDSWTFKIFEPPISYHEFIDIKASLICPDCDIIYNSIPEIKDPEEKENVFNAIKRSLIESSEDWHSTLVEKYNDLQIIAEDSLPGLWSSLEFIISVQKILNIADCTLPFAGILLGSPSSLKTVGIELFRKWHNTF